MARNERTQEQISTKTIRMETQEGAHQTRSCCRNNHKTPSNQPLGQTRNQRTTNTEEYEPIRTTINDKYSRQIQHKGNPNETNQTNNQQIENK